MLSTFLQAEIQQQQDVYSSALMKCIGQRERETMASNVLLLGGGTEEIQSHKRIHNKDLQPAL